MGVPNPFRVVGAVGWVTFLEVLRDKIFYNIVLFGLLLFGVSILASNLTFIRPDRVVLDFGVTAVNLACTAIAILTGAGLLGKEFERRTIYVALSRPISRAQFVFGKFFGLSLVLFLNWSLLAITFLVILFTHDGAANFHATLVLALGLLFLQSLVMGAIAIMFSAFSTTSLSVIMTTGLFLVGNNISQIRLIAARSKEAEVKVILNTISSLLPNLEHFNLGFKVTYGLPVTWQFGLTSIAYGICLTLLCIGFAGYLIRTKEA